MVNQPTVARLDAALPEFTPTPNADIQGTISCVGSDSMDPVVQLWASDFRQHYPKVSFEILSKGSGTAPKALIAGTSQIGHMSREMNAQELAQFEAKFGYLPTRVVVAVDALAVYVNVNNPIRSLTLEQVDAIFSSTRKAGHPEDLAVWGDLGLKREWATRSIQPYGRDENSGTRAFFKEHALKKGEYKASLKVVADQFALVEAPAVDAAGISYGPVQHSVRMVRAVPIVDFKGDKPMVPTVENILNGKYPLTRFLYLYVNRKPGQPMNPLVREFVLSILTRQGQKAVAEFGALPLPADMVLQNVGKLK
jgi:phosphate transport system substrate-binding protein